VEVDNFGSVWVADVANNRVQRFNFDGIVKADWGIGEPQITNKWFSQTRAHFASAREPSIDPKGFWNPVDLCVASGKTGDTLYVLDAMGKVTVIDDTGVISKSWVVPQETGIIPSAGGEGFIVLVKGSLVVIWGNEGWSYSLDGEELGHFDLEDGSPTGAVALKSKVGLIYGDQLIQYSLDGFRHGDVMMGAMGKGFEAWDVSLDEEGKLWAVTDKATLVKFKKPGKVDFEVRIADYSIAAPRLDVYDGHVFVSASDAIMKIDALELEAQQGLLADEVE
jgi:streptogramin lyase